MYGRVFNSGIGDFLDKDLVVIVWLVGWLCENRRGWGRDCGGKWSG